MKADRKIRLSFLIVLCLFAALHLFIVLLNHYYFRTVALDYAVYNFAFYDFAHLRLSACPVYIFPFPANFLQDHFSLTLPLLSPLYWLLAPVFGTYTLLIIQWLLVMAGAVYTFKLIAIKSQNSLLALAAFIFYFVLFGRYSAYRADANLAIMGSAAIPVFLYFFEAKRKWPMIIVFVLLLFNREDYSLWFIFISAFLMIIHRNDQLLFRRSSLLMLTSLVFFILVLKVIIPTLEDENKKYELFSFTVLGETPGKALKFILMHPLEAIKYLFVNHSDTDYHNGIKLNFYLVYLISGGVLLFLRPVYLIPFIPILAKKMYDDNPLRWSIESYYSVEFVSLMPVMIFMVIALLVKQSSWRVAIGFSLCALASIMLVYKMFVPPPNPIVGESYKYNFLNADFYKPTLKIKEVNALLNVIPEGAAVSATSRLLPHLAFRDKVYFFPNVANADYIALIKQDDTYPLSPSDFNTELLARRDDKTWQIASETNELVLFKRVSVK